MATYRIPFTQEVSGHVTVEADTLAEAVREAEKEGLPGLMFLNDDYPDETGWEVDEQALIDNYPGEEPYADDNRNDQAKES